MPEEPGGVLGGFSPPCEEFGEVKGCFCTHHKQLSQAGMGAQLANRTLGCSSFFYSDTARVGGNGELGATQL